MSNCKWKHYRREIILGCVRWYCKYGISYRNLEEMMLERGIEVDHTTLYRWTQQYAPEIEKRLRCYWKPTLGYSWRVDETLVFTPKTTFLKTFSSPSIICYFLSSTIFLFFSNKMNLLQSKICKKEKEFGKRKSRSY